MDVTQALTIKVGKRRNPFHCLQKGEGKTLKVSGRERKRIGNKWPPIYIKNHSKVGRLFVGELWAVSRRTRPVKTGKAFLTEGIVQ